MIDDDTLGATPGELTALLAAAGLADPALAAALLPVVARGAELDPGALRALDPRVAHVVGRAAARVGARPPPPSSRSGLYPILDLAPTRPMDVVLALADRVLPTRPAVVQLRAKGTDDRVTVLVARALVARARAFSVPVVVNDRADIARAAGARGVHVGQTDLDPADVRAILGPDAWIGASSHTAEELATVAAHPDVTHVAWGPVYASSTKVGHAAVTGPEPLARARAAARGRPLVAIGGIRGAVQAFTCAAHGADLVAVVSALADAPDPAATARLLTLAHALGECMRGRS